MLRTMNLLFILAFILLVATTSYLLHQYQSSIRQKTRKSSLPLPPIGNSDCHLKPQAFGKTGDSADTHSHTFKAPDNWQRSITELRKEGQTEPALKLCKSKFPSYSAYKRATVILRSLLKTKGLSKRRTHKILLSLYKTAATAEMIHMKRSRENAISSSELKNLNMTLIESISFNYNELGYTEIPLLTRKDIKTIVSHWGEPKKHDSPRKAYQKYID